MGWLYVNVCKGLILALFDQALARANGKTGVSKLGGDDKAWFLGKPAHGVSWCLDVECARHLVFVTPRHAKKDYKDQMTRASRLVCGLTMEVGGSIANSAKLFLTYLSVSIKTKGAAKYRYAEFRLTRMHP